GLTLGKLAECAGLAGRAAEMAEEAEDRRLLGLLLALLVGAQTGSNGRDWAGSDGSLSQLTGDDEHRLLDLARSLGEPDTVRTLLRPLRAARSDSHEVQSVFFEALVAKGRMMVERSDWFQAEKLLGPYADDPGL